MAATQKRTVQRNTQGDLSRLAEAFRRMNATNPVALTEWLLAFTRKNLSVLPEQEWEPLQEEIWAFSTMGTLGMMGRKDADSIRRISQTQKDVEMLPIWLTKSFISGLQQISRKGIHEFLHDGSTFLPPITGTHFLMKSSTGVDAFFIAFPTALDTPFIQELADLLRQVGAKLAVCDSPQCKKEFVIRRYGQEYCSNTCRSREAMRKHREKERAKKAKLKSKAKGGSKRGTKKR